MDGYQSAPVTRRRKFETISGYLQVEIANLNIFLNKKISNYYLY